MSHTPSISLIVIYHNAERTIERTLRSLAAQTLDDVEYLFVDDGSSDRTTEVVKTFMALNPDFAARHKLIISNMRMGTAHATAVGVENATGRYVMRCDADDYMEPDMLAAMLTASEGGSADMVACSGYVRDSERGSRIVMMKRLPASLNDCAIDTLHFSLCFRLIRRQFIVDNGLLPFEGIDCWEDLGVVSRVMALAPATTYVERPLYHYVQASGSLSRSRAERLIEDHVKMAMLLEQWMSERGLAERYGEFLDHVKFAAKVRLVRGPERDVARWKRTFPEVNGRLLRLRHVAWRYRLLFRLAAWMPARLVQWLADAVLGK